MLNRFSIALEGLAHSFANCREVGSSRTSDLVITVVCWGNSSTFRMEKDSSMKCLTTALLWPSARRVGSQGRPHAATAWPTRDRTGQCCCCLLCFCITPLFCICYCTVATAAIILFSVLSSLQLLLILLQLPVVRRARLQKKPTPRCFAEHRQTRSVLGKSGERGGEIKLFKHPQNRLLKVGGEESGSHVLPSPRDGAPLQTFVFHVDRNKSVFNLSNSPLIKLKIEPEVK